MAVIEKYLPLAGVMLLWGCAFDVSHVKQMPVSFATLSGPAQSFILNENVEAKLGTGFPTRLNILSRWHQVGTTEYGEVFTTKDQVVTVEASNIYEAELVVSNRCITGFYLPVEMKFVPVGHPIPIATKSVD